MRNGPISFSTSCSWLVVVACLTTGCGGGCGGAAPQPASSLPTPETPTPSATSGDPSVDADYLGTLSDRLARSSVTDVDALVASVPATVGTARAEPGGGWTLTLRAPMSARELCAKLGWERAYGVSTDVHQQQFHVHLFASTLSPDRIATRVPTAGPWEIRARLVSRPAGELPPLVAGASPAYDLTSREATIEHISIEPAR